jgi:crossover junction endodeoxyribonuclease RuvC
VLTGSGGSPKLLKFGCIETDKKLPHHERLVRLAHEVERLLTEHQPTGVSLERLFFSTNVKTAMSVAEARGVITLTVSHFGCPLYEFSPQEVKLAATGQGRADKKQVQKMLKLMFKLKEAPRPDDAADAVAVALCGLSYHPRAVQLGENSRVVPNTTHSCGPCPTPSTIENADSKKAFR